MRFLIASCISVSLVGCSDWLRTPVAASSAELVAPPGAIALLTWEDEPAGCRADLTIVGGATTPIGAIPGACPEQAWRDASAIRTADGRLLLKTPSGALQRSKDGVVTVLTPLSASWSFDDVGYDAAGGIVAGGRWTATESEVLPAGETSRHTWTIEGEPVVYLASSGDADATVCGWFPWIDGAWGKPVLEPMGLTEGTNSAHCVVNAEGAPEPLPRASEGPWIPVVGFEARRGLAQDRHDTWMIACQAGHAAVVDVANGAVLWSGAVCPTAWPPG